jgi:diguanylate cyclase (GGDEF)-like protein
MQISFIIAALISIIVAILFFYGRRKYLHDEQMKEITYIDSLTGIWNINKFTIEAEDILCNKDSRNFAVLSMDIVKFRYINDCYGHEMGDSVLKYVAQKIEDNLYEGEIFARTSCDKFVILAEYIDQTQTVERLKDACLQLENFEQNNQTIKLCFNCGIFVMEEQSDIVLGLDKADIARKYIKGKSKNSFAFFDSKIEQELIRQKEIEDGMEKALENGEFVVYYQPKIDLTTMEISGAEALVRWDSSKHGFLNPCEFVPILEQNGFIVDLDFYVLEQVCALLKKWIDSGIKPICISVNQSRKHLSNSAYLKKLQCLTEKYNVPSELIELELTESMFFDNKEVVVKTMKNMRKLGFVLSMDDFGSGYSSLNLLKEIPIDVLKIDKSFLEETETSEKTKIIIEQVVIMARKLKMKVVCEGVETQEQADFLKKVYCDTAQGYLYAKPMSLMDFVETLETQKMIS